MRETLTILTSAAGQALGKSFIGVSLAEGRFSAGGEFYVSESPVDSLASLSKALSTLEIRSDQTVVRGELLNFGADPVRRTQQYFQAVSRQWCMLDIDGLDAEEATSDPIDLIKYAVEQLPSEFLEVDFWYQFSSSMGIKPGIRVHLWYWLERTCSDDEMKVWLRDYPVDLKLFNPLQMHLTAAPQFKDGAIDPFPCRSGLFAADKGKATVSVPVDLSTRSQAYVAASRPRSHTKSNQLDHTEVIRDPETGLAIDGREKLLFQLSNEVTASLTSENYIPTVEEISDALWTRFTEEADLSVCNGKVWSKDDARQKSIARRRELDEQRFTFLTKSEKTMLFPAEGAAARPNLLSSTDAKIKLDQILSSFFDRLSKGETPRATVRITMGAGKTKETIGKLRGYLKKRWGQLIEVYVPRHDLALEWKMELLGNQNSLGTSQAINAEVIHVRPRTGGSFDAKTNQYQHQILCHRAEYVRELESKGHSVYGNACMSNAANDRCKFFQECDYLDQFREPQNAGSNIVRIYTHTSLFLPRIEFERQQVPNLMIIDEGFIATATNKLPSVEAEDVRQWVRTTHNDKLGLELMECLKNKDGFFSYLEQNGIFSSDFAAVSLAAINPTPPFSSDAAKPHNLRTAKLYKNLNKVLEIARDELKDAGRTKFEQLVYGSHEDAVVVCEHRKIRLSRSTPVLYLDATADPLVTDAYLSGMDLHQVNVRQRAIVSQVYDRTGSNSFWEGKIKNEQTNLSAKTYDSGNDDLSLLVNILNKWVELGEKPLIVGHKEIANFLREHPHLNKDVQIAHFNSLRGSNAYKDCSVIFITGRHQPPVDAIERQARSVFGSGGPALGKDNTSKLPRTQVNYWLSDRSPHSPSGINTQAFSDPRADAVLKQVREAETLQVIARLRLVWADYQKRLFLLSNLPVEIPVDHLIRFNDLMPDKLELELMRMGDLPLTSLGLTKMRADLGYSDDAAKKQVARSKASDPMSLLKQLPTLLRNSVQIATFKAGDRRKTEHTHLFLPKGYSGDPHAATYQLWTEEEVFARLEQGWGEGKVFGLRLSFLYGS